METEVKWHRVIDPLSPLYGCDVRLGPERLDFHRRKDGPLSFAMVYAMRRIDIFVGDRPFQLIAPEGESLGLMIDRAQLEASPLQDEVVELATDLPYGEFIEEIEVPREDDCVLHLVAYERMFQVALLIPGRPDPGLLGNKVPREVAVSRVVNCSPDEIASLRKLFESGASVSSVKRMIEVA